jgi:hypothetical protein
MKIILLNILDITENIKIKNKHQLYINILLLILLFFLILIKYR